MAFVAVIPAVGSTVLPGLGGALSLGTGALGSGLAGLGGLATSIPGIGGMLGSGLGGLGGGLASLGGGLGGALGALGGGSPLAALGSLGKGLGGSLGSLGAGVSGGGLPNFQNMINGVGPMGMLPTGVMGSLMPRDMIGAVTGEPMNVGVGFDKFINTIGDIGQLGQDVGLGSQPQSGVGQDEIRPREIMPSVVSQGQGGTINRGLGVTTPGEVVPLQTGISATAMPTGIGGGGVAYSDNISGDPVEALAEKLTEEDDIASESLARIKEQQEAMKLSLIHI